MDDVKTRLRNLTQTLRRTPKPLSEFIPLLQEAADRIDYLENKLEEHKDYHV